MYHLRRRSLIPLYYFPFSRAPSYFFLAIKLLVVSSVFLLSIANFRNSRCSLKKNNWSSFQQSNEDFFYPRLNLSVKGSLVMCKPIRQKWVCTRAYTGRPTWSTAMVTAHNCVHKVHYEHESRLKSCIELQILHSIGTEALSSPSLYNHRRI